MALHWNKSIDGDGDINYGDGDGDEGDGDDGDNDDKKWGFNQRNSACLPAGSFGRKVFARNQLETVSSDLLQTVFIVFRSKLKYL